MLAVTSAEAQDVFAGSRAFLFGNQPELADFAYDTARDICRLATFLATLVAIAYPFFMKKRPRLLQNVQRWLAVASVPILINVGGMFLIRSFFGVGEGF